jgi:hypothetical protein
VSEESDRSHDRIWYVRQGGRESGPYPSGQLRRLLDDAIVQLDDEVSEDRQGWRRAREVPEVLPMRFRRPEGSADDVREAEKRHDTRTALRSLAAIGLLVAVALAAAWLYQGRTTVPAADCAATPGPGVNLARCLLDGLGATGLDLAGAVLNNASLAGARLERAVLERADLRYANLAAAQLGYLRAADAQLKGANLRAADLAYADLRNADLSYADLSGAVLGGAVLDGARFDHALWVDGTRCAPGSVGACVPAP